MSAILENPHGNCALGGAAATLSAIRRVIPLYHSGPGCAMQNTTGEPSQGSLRLPYYVQFTAIPCTNMQERDVVFGGEAKLDKHIEGALEILDADAFFVLTGCTAGIIGDDVHTIADRYRSNGHPVYAIDSAGFLGESYRGYEIAMNALAEYIIDPAPTQTDEHLVNVVGIMPHHDPYWEGNFEEIVRLLERLDLRVNTFFSHEQSIADVRSASSASLNIVVNPWLLQKFCKTMQDKFAIPSLRFAGVPLGPTDTAEFLRAIGKATNRVDKAEALIEAEARYYYHYLETGIGLQSWRRFAVVGESTNVIPLVRLLANDYSFTPEVAIMTDVVFRDEDKAYITDKLTVLEYANPPEVVFTGDQWEITKALEKHPETTLIIGTTVEGEYAMAHNIQHFIACYPNSERLIYNRSCAGYRGALTLFEDIYSNL